MDEEGKGEVVYLRRRKEGRGSRAIGVAKNCHKIMWETEKTWRRVNGQGVVMAMGDYGAVMTTEVIGASTKTLISRSERSQRRPATKILSKVNEGIRGADGASNA